MRRFYAPIEQFQTSTVSLNLEETRHLRDVLRLKEFDKAQVFDGDGREFLCEIQSIGKKETRLKILEEIVPNAPESNLNLTLAVALLKGEKFDLVVQKAVELGVTKLFPLNTKRADVKIKDTEKRVERWRKIALEACKQSGRATLMPIENPVDFGKFIETAGGTKILFAERGGESFSAIEKSETMTAVVGAEGGWEDFEIEAARNKNFQIVTLNGRILRAETAAISIAAILQNQFGDLN
ncbi:MAG: 16S rRNA (uracil(1498)-N(3))-methyltransferase [Pyrinomonadaceae bacterium]|nr:16S rRNA (uracil(1498)-N(3))-methyltransferase [Pyrinomonadaceae bacterium]